MDPRLFSAIDASINRAMEGLRVCEDILRFSLRDAAFSSLLKDVRHRLGEEASRFPAEFLLSARDVEGDGQKFYDTESEMKRSSIPDLLRVNFRRAIEAVRSLEELSKAVDAPVRPDFQRIRFSLYSLEKDVVLAAGKTSSMDSFACALYAIVDSAFVTDGGYAAAAAAFIEGGARIIQLRMKGSPSGQLLAAAKDCAAVCRERGALFIVNDRPDIALCVGAHGVHLGQDDIPAPEARKMLPAGMIVGISTHSPGQALAASAQSPDYIAIGPVFGTSSKHGAPLEGIGTGVIAEIRRSVSTPIVAIGGIDPGNAGQAIGAGADSCAVISFLYRDGALEANCGAVAGAMAAAWERRTGRGL